ncbi:MAG: hypothetical protein N2202_01460 [Proteobacteria bacterium]|nr:hypothetical protein [Pseudomonadota bacterium]
MNYRVFEIIKFISQRVMEESALITEEIFDELIMEGYNHDEIEEAITWIDSYQKNVFLEGDLDLKDSYKEIFCTESAYNYLKSLMDMGFINEDYVDDLLRYIIFSHNKAKLDIWDLIANDRILRFCRKEWAEEALANYKAFNLKKDC